MALLSFQRTLPLRKGDRYRFMVTLSSGSLETLRLAKDECQALSLSVSRRNSGRSFMTLRVCREKIAFQATLPRDGIRLLDTKGFTRPEDTPSGLKRRNLLGGTAMLNHVTSLPLIRYNLY